MSFNAREAAHALLGEMDETCCPPWPHSPRCNEATTALQRAYDAGRDAGLAKAEAIARECGQQLIISRACGLVADAIARERTSPAAAPVSTLREEWDGFCANPEHGEMCDNGGLNAECRPQPAAAPVEPPKETTR